MIDSRKEKPSFSDVDVVSEFPDVFSEDLLGIPPAIVPDSGIAG